MFRPIRFRAMLHGSVRHRCGDFRLGCAAQQTDSSQDKHLDIQSSVGDLHMGNDADARKAGLAALSRGAPAARRRERQRS